MMSEDNARKVIEIIKSSGGFPVSLKSLITTMAFRNGASEDEANTAIGIAAMDDSVSFKKEGSGGEPAGFVYLHSSTRAASGIEEVSIDEVNKKTYNNGSGLFEKIVDEISKTEDEWHTAMDLFMKISPALSEYSPSSIQFSIKKLYGPQGLKYHHKFRRGALPNGQWLYRKKLPE